ncbi:MAG: hypothetical protein GXN92_01140 [Candidatus Micrarchaeota archaeon]|nr:hypothetical protein [Candidatus Micrarchaeota archaeon]
MRACRNCKAIVYGEGKGLKCWNCGSTDLTKHFSGIIIILSEDSVIAQKLGLKPGEWAVEIND